MDDKDDKIRIHHEFEGGNEKSAPRITDWHHDTYRGMTNGDREGRIFLSHPHTNYGFYFLLILYIGKTCKRFPENSEYAEMPHLCDMVTSF